MASTARWTSDHEFEREVIRIARLRWPNTRANGSIVVDGLERDGVFVTDDVVHILECTTSRQKKKAQEDIRKSIDLARRAKIDYAPRAVICWFITADEPLPDQNSVAVGTKEFPVYARSYDSFRAQLIDAKSYLAARDEAPFGSARSLDSNSHQIAKNAYIALDILDLTDRSTCSVRQLADRLLSRQTTRAVMLGDFGAGKSMTLRDIYYKLSDAYRSGETIRFPVYLNLRDHGGQTFVAEAFERHARLIGFDRPDHLVRAWRAGFVILLLDGFDELSSSGWMQFNAQLKDVRFRTMEIVRKLISETTADTPVLIAGRGSYFDTNDECLSALGLNANRTHILSLNDFSDSQIKEMLRQFNQVVSVPEWLPTRPLLVGYLISRGVLNSGLAAEIELGRGWHTLLSLICEREAATHALIDAAAVRKIIERLATTARAQGGLLAPLTTTNMATAFFNIVGFSPDEAAETLLMRLPGMGPSPHGAGKRSFIDIDFGNAAGAGDVTKFVASPYSQDFAELLSTQETLHATGISVAAYQVIASNLKAEQLFAAIRYAVIKGEKTPPQHGIAGDILKIILSSPVAASRDSLTLAIREVAFDELDLTTLPFDLSGIVLKDCAIANLYLQEDASGDGHTPRFERTLIEYVDGRSGIADVDTGKHYLDCQFGLFSETVYTNAAVLDSNLELGIKVLLIALRKLFIQKGSGRKESALYRGIPSQDRWLVDLTLQALQSADFAHRVKPSSADAIWYPNRRMSARVNGILLAPAKSSESLIISARKFAKPVR